MRHSLGALVQFTGLVLLPVAVWYGLQGGDLFTELLIATGGLGAILVGRSMRAPAG